MSEKDTTPSSWDGENRPGHTHPVQESAPAAKQEQPRRPDAPKAPGVTLEAKDSEAYENDLRGRLGLLPIGVKLPRRTRRWGWIATGIAGLVAFVTRFWNLNHPRAVVFDETYYVKGAFSLLHKGYEGKWEGKNANDLFLRGDYSALKDNADYVVHPPLGKWIMAAGQWLFGSDNGVGWRFSTALVGVLAVILVARIAMRMFRSPLLAGFAGIAMALDGMGIVMSRTGILDNILAYFVLLGFWALLLDREHSRARLAARVARGRFRSLSGAPGAPHVPEDPWGPLVLGRPWLLAAGAFLGFAGGVKWSAIYAVAVFGLVAFAWSASARRTVGVRLWFGAGVFKDGLPAFFALIPATIAAYFASWIPWFANSHGWGRHWAEEAAARGEALPLSGAPNALNSFIHYHQEMWRFHHTLSSPHDYQSQMWDWIIQRRPVSFYWLGADKAPQNCGAKSCVEAITSVGNVAVWWLALPALIVVVLAAIKHRDWRAWAILAGYAAMWLPWISYTNRTIFQFYAVAFLPYVVLALTFAVGVAAQLVGRAHSGQTRLSFGLVSSPARPVWQQNVPRPNGMRSQLRTAMAVRFSDTPVPAGQISPPSPGAPNGPNAPMPPSNAATPPTMAASAPNAPAYSPNAPAPFPSGGALSPNGTTPPSDTPVVPLNETVSSSATSTPSLDTAAQPDGSAPSANEAAHPANASAPSPDVSATSASASETFSEDSPSAGAPPSDTAEPLSDAAAPAPDTPASSPSEAPHDERDNTDRFTPKTDETNASGAEAPLAWHPPEFNSAGPGTPPVPPVGPDGKGAPAQFGPSPQYGAPPQYGAQPQFGPPPQYGPPAQYGPPVAAPPKRLWWEPPARRATGIIFVGLVTAVIVGAAAFWYPLWTGQSISHSFWQMHMWLPSWI